MKTHAHTRSTWTAGFALAALIGALIAAAAVPRAEAAVPPSFYGVVPQTPVDASDFERMGKGQVGTVRILFAWNTVDPTAAPADYDWGTLDSIVTNADRKSVV